MHYDLFKISLVRNDILHLKLAQKRKIIGFISHFLEPTDYKTRQSYINILKEEWQAFYIDCYESNKVLNVLYGKHVHRFIINLIEKIVVFLAKMKFNIKVSRNLIILLKNWKNISRILSITYIKPEDQEKYKNQIFLYKLFVAQFKLAAKYTIFVPQSGSETEDTNENYYSHVLINYTVPMMEQTFNKYKLDIGIYFIQGIEQRNKESKNCAICFTNNRFNLCTSTMKRWFDLFFFSRVEY